MVRSTTSCFKIITCSSDSSVNEDGFERIESKGSTDKRGWSFRKRSDRHRNTVILEASSPGNRENIDAASVDLHGHTTTPTIAQIISAPRTDEVIPLSSEVNSKAPDTFLFVENASKIDPVISKESLGETGSLSSVKDAANLDPKMEESLAIVIQAAIRGYLSQKALLKIKNVVKLQAAVRGHLVRNQAVGTLRCVQAIVKVQALVRARRARIALEGSVIELKLDDGFGRNYQNKSTLGKEAKANPSSYCTEKILGNAFARQLLESTPKKKPIHIKCDPLRPDSAWKWLERWMSASSTDSAQQQKLQFNQKQEEQVRRIDTTACDIGTKAPAEVSSDATELNSSPKQTAMNSDGKENLIEEEDNFDFQFLKPTSSLGRDESQEVHSQDVGLNEAEETSSKIVINQKELPRNVTTEAVLDSGPSEPKVDSEQLKHSRKRGAPDQPEMEGKKLVIGSRKASNPAFVAAQSKFEELSSTTASITPITSTNQDVGVEQKLDRLLPPGDSETETTGAIMSENPIYHDPKYHAGGSDFGARLSVSSKVGSPDRLEMSGGEKENDSKVVKEAISDINSSHGNPSSFENVDVGCPVFVHPSNLEIVNGVDSVVNLDSQQPERNASGVQIQHDSAMDEPTYRSSPEGSPRSHITVTESHGTPSSQLSQKAKRKESKKSDLAQSRKSKSADKRSPSNPKHDSGIRNSMEKLSDTKNGKRRNSFGSAKTDHADQDPRESNSSSLPSYMQATESARAKAQASNSPRSSPDVQDSDLYIRKRHSLPSANGKQGSPRLSSSSPQGQHIAKGDNTHPSRERWQR